MSASGGVDLSQASVLSFFRDEVLGESVTPEERVKNIKRLRLIAAAVGPQAACTSLVKTLKEIPSKFPNEDELLFSLGEALDELPDYFPKEGRETHLGGLVPLLQELARLEETVVREQAVKTLGNLVDRLPESQRGTFTRDHILPVFEKLAKGSWFTSRVAACGIFSISYCYCSEAQRPDLQKTLSLLCHDETPMVRRAAAQKLREFFERCTDVVDLLDNFVVPSNSVFQYFWNDDTDTLRSSALDATVALAKKLSPAENLLHTVAKAKSAGQDRSWRVRLRLAQQLDELLNAYGSSITGNQMLSSIFELAQDPEQEVRTATLKSLENVFELLTAEQLISHGVPVLRKLKTDSAQSVRAALATVVSKAPALLGREGTSQYLLPLVEEFMKDEYADVRLNVVKHAGEICRVLGPDKVARDLLDTIQSLMSDSQWRIRLSVADQIPDISKHLGSKLYSSSLESLFMAALCDNVAAVRECALRNAKVLAENFGADWMVEVFLPKILENGTGSAEAFVPFQSKDSWFSPAERPHYTDGNGKPVSYLSRITVIHSLLYLAEAACVRPKQVETIFLPLILDAAKDHVANVRFAAAKAATFLVDRHLVSAPCMQSQVKPCFLQLLQDGDVDVRYFASKGLETVESVAAAQ